MLNDGKTRTSLNQQVPWRRAKNILFPYKDPVEKDKKWIKDRKELFKENGHDWMVKLWNKFW